MDWSDILKKAASQARKRGYFVPEDLEGHTALNIEQLKELNAMLEKLGIPIVSPSTEITLTQQQSKHIIDALRKGVPPSSGITSYSVGRKELVDRFTIDLKEVSQSRNRNGRIRFLNADWGHGKTHSLHLLREIAYEQDFVVSKVTLSQHSCPMDDFTAVYDEIMWNLRTKEEQKKPALENVLDRWLSEMGETDRKRVARIVSRLPSDLVNALNAYYASTGPVKPDEEKRIQVLDYLSGKKVYLNDLKRIDIRNRIDHSNALEMLGYMTSLFRNLKYAGICILFDEAESIHSFQRWDQQDKAYSNLVKIIKKSQSTPHCLFIYATTPSFFENYSSYWPRQYRLRNDEILELESLDVIELSRLVSNVCKIYFIAYDFGISEEVEGALKEMAKITVQENESIGDFIRRCIAILDEKRNA